MKNTVSAIIFLLSAMLSATFSNAQSCPSNKVWTCRVDACGVTECKCLNPSQVLDWTAITPPCSNKNWWHPHCCDGWRMIQSQAGTGIKIYPNPVSNLTTISFTVEQAQKVSIRVVDMSGRLVTVIEDETYLPGNHQIVWSASGVNAGIYFLQFQSAEHGETIKLVVTK